MSHGSLQPIHWKLTWKHIFCKYEQLAGKAKHQCQTSSEDSVLWLFWRSYGLRWCWTYWDGTESSTSGKVGPRHALQWTDKMATAEEQAQIENNQNYTHLQWATYHFNLSISMDTLTLLPSFWHTGIWMVQCKWAAAAAFIHRDLYCIFTAKLTTSLLTFFVHFDRIQCHSLLLYRSLPQPRTHNDARKGATLTLQQKKSKGWCVSPQFAPLTRCLVALLFKNAGFKQHVPWFLCRMCDVPLDDQSVVCSVFTSLSLRDWIH